MPKIGWSISWSRQPVFTDATIETVEVAQSYLARVIVRALGRRYRIDTRIALGRLTKLKISPALPDITWTDEQVTGSAGDIRVRRYGHETIGRPVLLLHRGENDVSQWDWMAAELPGQLFALDLRAHGPGDPTTPFTFAGITEDIATVADHFNLDQPLLIGHSFGGYAALTAAVTLGWPRVVTLDGPLGVEQPPTRGAGPTDAPELIAALPALVHFDLPALVPGPLPGWHAVLCRDADRLAPGRAALAEFAATRQVTVSWLDGDHLSLVAFPGAARDLLAAEIAAR